MYRHLNLEDKGMWADFRHQAKLPSKVRQHLTPFQEVLVVKCLQPGALVPCLKDFVCSHLSLCLLFVCRCRQMCLFAYFFDCLLLCLRDTGVAVECVRLQSVHNPTIHDFYYQTSLKQIQFLHQSLISHSPSKEFKELSPGNTNLTHVYERDMTNTEGVLFIVSNGSDPSQELEKLAKKTVGMEKFVQVGGLWN